MFQARFLAHHAMRETPMFSLSEAAAAAGISKSTLWRAIKSGRVSATRTDTGDYRVEPSELHRVFPPATAETRSTPPAMKRDATALEQAETALLEAQICALKDTAALLRTQLEDTRTDRDHWRDQAQAVTRQLADARPARPRGGLFARLFAKVG